MVLHSYGMLLPCGVDKFHGTEYVCCLSAPAQEPTPAVIASQEEGEDDDDDDAVDDGIEVQDEDDEEEDEDLQDAVVEEM